MNRTMFALLASLSTLVACHTEGPPSSTAADASPPPAATAAASPTTTGAAAPGPAAPVVARHDRALKDLVAGAQTLRVSASEPKAKTIEVKAAKDIGAVVDALGPAQTSTDGAPRCTTPFTLSFLDASGATLAQLNLCDSAGLGESSKSQGRLSEPREQAGGFNVANLGALRATLKPLGIDLP